MVLTSTLLSIPSIFILGYVLDRFKVWKFVTFFVCLFITALTLFIRYSEFDEILLVGQGSLIQDISFVTILWCLSCQYQCASTLMTKALESFE